MWSPGAKGHILMGNTCFGEAGLHRQNHPAAVGAILVSGRLAAIFAGHEFAGLLYLQRFADESSGYASLKSGHPTSVHRHGTVPASGSMHPQNLSQPLSRR